MSEVEHIIRKFIANEIMFSDDESSVTLDYPLLETGTIDSMDLQRLISFLDETFKISVADDDLLHENFENVRAIAELVGKLERPSDP